MVIYKLWLIYILKLDSECKPLFFCFPYMYNSDLTFTRCAHPLLKVRVSKDFLPKMSKRKKLHIRPGAVFEVLLDYINPSRLIDDTFLNDTINNFIKELLCLRVQLFIDVQILLWGKKEKVVTLLILGGEGGGGGVTPSKRSEPDVQMCSVYLVLEQVEIYLTHRQFDK